MFVLVYRSHRDCTVMFLYNRRFVCGGPLLEICHETHCVSKTNGVCERFGLVLGVPVVYLKINPSLAILMLHNN